MEGEDLQFQEGLGVEGDQVAVDENVEEDTDYDTVLDGFESGNESELKGY